MKAEIITYETKKLTNSQRSTISKKLFGYKDRTKKSQYTYKRPGILKQEPHIKITKKTFITDNENAKEIKKTLKKLGAKVKSWKITITKHQLKKR